VKRGVVVGIVVAAVLVVAGGGAAAWFLTRPPSPQSVADDYLRALSKGDISTIERLLVAGTADLPQIESAFAGASGHISHYSVTVAGSSDAERSARADVELGGSPAVVGFTLVQHDGTWKVKDPFGSLTATTTLGDSVRVGDALVKTDAPVALLPAAYPVNAAPQGLLTGESTAVVTTGKPVTVAVDAALSPNATSRAQEQLDAYADACTKPATAVPDQCGIRVPWAADLATLESLAFRVDAYPTLTLSDDGRTFDAVDGKIVATATGTTRAGDDASFTYSADDWALRGSVTFEGDEMVLAVR
jgi:hypothetical protein